MVDLFWFWFPISALLAGYLGLVALLGVELLIEALRGGDDG